MIASFDEAIGNIQTKFDSWIQDVKIILGNFPEFLSKLSETMGSMFSKLVSYDNVKTIVLSVVEAVPKLFETMLKRMSLILDLFLNAIPDAVKGVVDGIGNYVMYIVTNACDEIGFSVTELINSIGSLLTESPVGRIIDSVVSTAVNGIRLIGTLLRNIPEMISIVAENGEAILRNIFTSLKNWFFGSLSDTFLKAGQLLETLNLAQRIENIRTDITNVFGRMGSWFSAIGETAKDTFRCIGEVLRDTFSWETLKTSVTVLFKNLGAVASAAIKTLFVNIPSMLTGICDGVISWGGYLGVRLKNTLVEAVQNFIRDAGPHLQGTWVDKLFGLGSALAGLDFGIDRSGEEKLLSESVRAFSSVGQGFETAVSDVVDAAALIKDNTKDISDLYSSIDGIKVSVPEYTEVAAEIKETGRLTEALLSLSDRFAEKTEDNTVEWREITGKFAALLSPEIERWEKESGETIGEQLTAWTAKSLDDYLDASMKSFASIGKTLTEWDVSFKDEIISELDVLWGIVRPI